MSYDRLNTSQDFLNTTKIKLGSNKDYLQNHRDILKSFVKEFSIPINLEGRESRNSIRSHQTNDLEVTPRGMLSPSNQGSSIKPEDLEVTNKSILDGSKRASGGKQAMSNIDALIEKIKQKSSNWNVLDKFGIQIDNESKLSNDAKTLEPENPDDFLTKLKAKLYRTEEVINKAHESLQQDNEISRLRQREVEDTKMLTKKIDKSLSPKKDDHTLIDSKLLNSKFDLPVRPHTAEHKLKYSPQSHYQSSSPDRAQSHVTWYPKNKLDSLRFKPEDVPKPELAKKIKDKENKESSVNRAMKQNNNNFLKDFKKKMADLKKDYNLVTKETAEQYKQMGESKSPKKKSPSPYKSDKKSSNNKKKLSKKGIPQYEQPKHTEQGRNSSKANITDLESFMKTPSPPTKIDALPKTSSNGNRMNIIQVDDDCHISPIIVHGSPDMTSTIPRNRGTNSSPEEFITPSKKIDAEKISELSYSQSHDGSLMASELIQSREGFGDLKKADLTSDFMQLMQSTETLTKSQPWEWTKELEEEFERFVENDDETKKMKAKIMFHESEILRLKLSLY
jgi:hypothetical protein